MTGDVGAFVVGFLLGAALTLFIILVVIGVRIEATVDSGSIVGAAIKAAEHVGAGIHP